MKTTPAMRRLAGAATGALLIALLPAATVSATQHDDVCRGAPEGAFEDVAPGNVHATNIDCIAAHDITIGIGGGRYDPAGSVSREQMATFLVNLAETALQTGFDVPEDSPFTDIDGSVHEDNIRIAYEQGITVGLTEDRFGPDERVRRDQMASFVANTIQQAVGGTLPEPDEPHFADVDGNVHEDNINALAEAAIVVGVGDDRYDPDGDVRRDQMATFLAHAAGFVDGQGLWAAPPLDPDLATYTAAPELVRVEPVSETDADVRLRFVFDDDLVASPDASAFHLVRGDTRVTAAAAAERESGAPSNVLADFPRAEYEQATTAAVSSGAVTDVDALANPEAAYPLQTVVHPAGITDDPNLVAVEFGQFDEALPIDDPPGGIEVRFTFDTVLDQPEDADPTGFHLVTADGDIVAGGSNESDAEAGDTVTVAFAVPGESEAEALEDDTRRAYVEADATGAGNPLQAVAVADEGTTERPDLVAVTLDDDADTATFVFDRDVVTAAADIDDDALLLHRLDGTEVGGTLESASDAEVTVAYGAGEVNDTIVLATVATGAVVGTDTEPAAADSVGLEQAFAAGTTVGPLLLDVDVAVEETEQLDGTTTFDGITISYTFGQAVSVHGGFLVYGEDGTRYDLEDGATLPGGAFDCAADGIAVACTSQDEDNAALADVVLGGIADDAVADADVDGFTSHPDGQGAG